MTVHGLKPEFQPSNFSKVENNTQTEKAPEVIRPSTGEHEDVKAVSGNSSAITGLGTRVDIKS